jgi:hypothetical protein
LRKSKNVHPVRRSEWFLLAYFAYVALAGLILGVGFKPCALLVVVSIVLLALAGHKSVLRDLMPLAYTLAAFREMDWFTPAVHDHHLERAWIVWDRRLLDDFSSSRGHRIGGSFVSRLSGAMRRAGLRRRRGFRGGAFFEPSPRPYRSILAGLPRRDSRRLRTISLLPFRATPYRFPSRGSAARRDYPAAASIYGS